MGLGKLCSHCGHPAIKLNCPMCTYDIEEDYEDDYHEVVELYCKFCKMKVNNPDPHFHQGGPVCDDCWDDRLYTTQ